MYANSASCVFYSWSRRQVYDLLNGRSPVAFAASAARASSSRIENRLKNAQFDANGKWVAPLAMCVHIMSVNLESETCLCFVWCSPFSILDSLNAHGAI